MNANPKPEETEGESEKQKQTEDLRDYTAISTPSEKKILTSHNTYEEVKLRYRVAEGGRNQS